MTGRSINGDCEQSKIAVKILLRTSGEGAPLEINGLFRAFSTSELESTLVLSTKGKRLVFRIHMAQDACTLRDWRGTKTENSLFPSHPQSGDTEEEEEICSYCHVLITAFKEVRNRHGKTQLR